MILEKPVKAYGMLFAWLVILMFMAVNYMNDPAAPFSSATDPSMQYGHNNEDSLKFGGVLSFIELCIFYVLIRPWSFHQSISRPLLALLLFLPWLLFSLMICMHSGGVTFIHFLWVLLINFVLIVSFITSAVARIQAITQPKS